MEKHGSYYIAANDQGAKWPYWLRTPVSDCNHDMRYVQSNGTVGRESPDVSYIGVRPAFYLDADYYVTTGGDGTEANPYMGSAPDKIENDYTVAEPEDDPNQDWDINVENSLKLNLGPYYSKDGKYAEPIIPVYTIQKTRSDTENMVIIIAVKDILRVSNKNLLVMQKEFGAVLCNTSHIGAMPTALTSMRFVPHQNQVLKMMEALFLM